MLAHFRGTHIVAVLLTLAVIMAIPGPTSAQSKIININSRSNNQSNPVNVFLEAGTYLIEPIGTADGGTFDAWNPWGRTSCSNPDGCQRTSPTTVTGWMNNHLVMSPDIVAVTIEGTPGSIDPTIPGYHVDDGFVYPTAIMAIANAQSSVFALRASGDVGFAIPDSPLLDNAGGMSLRITLESTMSIFPKTGGDTGFVSVHIFGSGFEEGATVGLQKEGEPEILGDPVAVSANGSLITTTFDLTGKTRGLWDVVVENPDGTTMTLAQGFEVEAGREPEIWVDIIGIDRFRSGRTQRIYILYSNRSNVDAWPVSLWISGIPKEAQLDLGTEINPPPTQLGTAVINWHEIPITLKDDNEQILPLIIPKVPVGISGVLELLITSSQSFDLKVRVDVARRKPNPPLLPMPMQSGEPFGPDTLHFSILQCTYDLASSLLQSTPLVDCIFANMSFFVELIFYMMEEENSPPPWSWWQAWYNVVAQCADEYDIPKGKWLDFTKDLMNYMNAAKSCAEAAAITWKSFTAVFSFDPNDKIGAGAKNEHYISGQEPVWYAIFFENLETATAPAQEVIITDQLDTANMNLTTFSFGPIAFGEELLAPPPGLPNYTTEVDLRSENNLIVQIIANLDSSTGLLTWRFRSIDPETGLPPDDPLVGFLPPNINPPEGHGSVLFTVMPKEGLTTGTEIINSASIVFDNNEPIQTPEWLNTIDNTKPDSQVLSLPSTQNTVDFEVQWTGTDEGAGVKDYTIFVSEDGGSYAKWLTNTPDTSGTFSGENGKTYEFYSVARDHTGNLEEAPEAPDTATTVVTNQSPVAQCKDVTVPADPSTCVAATASVDNGSSDPDEDPITLDQSPPGAYPLGATEVTLTVTDDKGASDSCNATVTVLDQEPPVINNLAANPNVLWPPNHKMRPVAVTADASDNCDSEPVCKITSVSSNEPVNGTGDGDTAPDWEITGDLTLNLRAERSGNGSGRIYTIAVECTDNAGNTATADTTVTVPHDKGKKK